MRDDETSYTARVIREIDAAELPALAGASLRSALAGGRALLVHGLWSADACAQMAARVLAERERWRHFPGFLNYAALGCPYYCYQQGGTASQYFDDIGESDAHIAALFPGLEAKIRGFMADLEAPRQVTRQPGFGGPGFVIMDEGSSHAPHFDLNSALVGIGEGGGAKPDRLEVIRRLAALIERFGAEDLIFTMVGMIALPRTGGRTLVWEQLFNFQEDYRAQAAKGRVEDASVASYRPGSVMLLNGLALHQTEACEGERITVTVHFVRTPDDQIAYWF